MCAGICEHGRLRSIISVFGSGICDGILSRRGDVDLDGMRFAVIGYLPVGYLVARFVHQLVRYRHGKDDDGYRIHDVVVRGNVFAAVGYLKFLKAPYIRVCGVGINARARGVQCYRDAEVVSLDKVRGIVNFRSPVFARFQAGSGVYGNGDGPPFHRQRAGGIRYAVI